MSAPPTSGTDALGVRLAKDLTGLVRLAAIERVASESISVKFCRGLAERPDWYADCDDSLLAT
jgi:hypothetical protein